jgi:tetratricopeptide (TPR) repeat protein
VLKHLAKRIWLLLPLAALVFALPTWWMRTWLPRQGAFPTPEATATLAAEDAIYAQALELAASDPLAALPLLNELAFSANPHAEAARDLWNGIQAGRTAEDEAYLFTASGQALAAAGEWDYARRAFLQAVELEPEYDEAWAFLGEALQQTGQDGLPALLRAMRLDQASISVRLFSALYWQRQGDYKQAELNLKIAALHSPQDPFLQIQLGQNAVMAGEGPEALEYFQDALALAPEDAETLIALATYSVETELYVEEVGLPSARRLLLQLPQDAFVLLLNARALALLGDTDSADAFFQRTLQVDETLVAGHLYYGIFLLADGQPEPARFHFDRVVFLAPESEEANLAAYWLEQISH